MADFNLIINEDEDMELVASVDDSAMEGMLSDEVVMQWLMDLEAEDSAADLQDQCQESAAVRLHA